MERRRLLASMAIGGLAGCLRLQGGTGDGTTTTVHTEMTSPVGSPNAASDERDDSETTEVENDSTQTEAHSTESATITESGPANITSVEDEWTQFNYDKENTGYNPSSSGPVKNIDLAWQFKRQEDVPDYRDRDNGDEWSPFIPVVWDGSVFISSQDDNIYSINASTGEEEWRFSTDVPTTDSSRKCTPAIANGMVLAEGSGGRFYALNAKTGKEQWRRDIVFDASHIQPTVDSNRVYVEGAGNVLALDVSDGSIVWARDDLGWTSTLTVGDKTVYTAQGGPEEFRLFALNKETGETDWSIQGPANICSLNNGTIYTTSSNNPEVSDSPAELFSIDSADGKINWRTEIPARPGGFHPPAIADGIVYLGTKENGNLYAYNADSGNLEWTYKTLSGAIKGTPTIAGDHVYFGTGWDGNVHCISRDDGTRKWTYSIGEIALTPTVTDGIVYVGSNSGSIHALTEAV